MPEDPLTKQSAAAAAAADIIKTANELKETAKTDAIALIELAKETSRELILKSGLDVSQLPLICFKIVKIQEDIKSIRETLQTTDGDHEIRIRSLEKDKWKIAGAIIVLSPIVTIGIALLVNWLTKR